MLRNRTVFPESGVQIFHLTLAPDPDLPDFVFHEYDLIKLAKLSLSGVEDGNLEEKYLSEQQYTLKAYALKDSGETRRAFVEKREATFEKNK